MENDEGGSERLADVIPISRATQAQIDAEAERVTSVDLTVEVIRGNTEMLRRISEEGVGDPRFDDLRGRLESAELGLEELGRDHDELRAEVSLAPVVPLAPSTNPNQAQGGVPWGKLALAALGGYGLYSLVSHSRASAIDETIDENEDQLAGLLFRDDLLAEARAEVRAQSRLSPRYEPRVQLAGYEDFERRGVRRAEELAETRSASRRALSQTVDVTPVAVEPDYSFRSESAAMVPSESLVAVVGGAVLERIASDPRFKGPRGAKGARGDRGLQGSTGSRGATGSEGKRGVPGPVGPRGTPGPANKASPSQKARLDKLKTRIEAREKGK